MTELASRRALVIIPTYNEVENLESIARKARAADPGIDILVVDDASPDGTGELADQLAAESTQVHVLHRAGKAGLGAAYIAGFRWGLDRGYQILVEMDADGSHPVQVLPELIRALEPDENLGAVIGSRWISGGGISNWSLPRSILSRTANRYAAFMLRLPVKDSTSGFRAYSAAALRSIYLTSVKSRGYGFQIDMTNRTLQAGWRIREIPIVFKERERGESKMSLDIVLEAMWFVTARGVRRMLRGKA